MLSGSDMVLNMAMSLCNATVIASNNTDEICAKPQGFRVSMPAKSREEFDRIYNALAKDAGAKQMAPDETFWAMRFAMFTDQYGTPWIFNYEGNTAQD